MGEIKIKLKYLGFGSQQEIFVYQDLFCWKWPSSLNIGPTASTIVPMSLC